MRSVRFGVLLLPSLGWAELSRQAVEVEAAGFDAIWTDDHIAHPTRPELPWLECFGALAGVAGVTTRVTIGPLVANIVLRRGALLASQALTVNELSGGRLDLGIGSGYDAGDHAAVGEPMWTPGERAERFAMAVSELRARLDVAAANARSRVPLTVAGHGPRAIALAARYADTWVSYGGFGLSAVEHLEVTRRHIDQLEQAADGREVGRRLLCGSASLTAEPIWQSAGAFEDFVGRYREIGIDEFAFHWPPAATSPSADPAVISRILDQLPSLR